MPNHFFEALYGNGGSLKRLRCFVNNKPLVTSEVKAFLARRRQLFKQRPGGDEVDAERTETLPEGGQGSVQKEAEGEQHGGSGMA